MRASVPLHVRPVSCVIYLQPLPVSIPNINVPLQTQSMCNVCCHYRNFIAQVEENSVLCSQKLVKSNATLTCRRQLLTRRQVFGVQHALVLLLARSFAA
jgi:hypothetical protein